STPRYLLSVPVATSPGVNTLMPNLPRSSVNPRRAHPRPRYRGPSLRPSRPRPPARAGARSRPSGPACPCSSRTSRPDRSVPARSRRSRARSARRRRSPPRNRTPPPPATRRARSAAAARPAPAPRCRGRGSAAAAHRPRAAARRSASRPEGVPASAAPPARRCPAARACRAPPPPRAPISGCRRAGRAPRPTRPARPARSSPRSARGRRNDNRSPPVRRPSAAVSWPRRRTCSAPCRPRAGARASSCRSRWERRAPPVRLAPSLDVLDLLAHPLDLLLQPHRGLGDHRVVRFRADRVRLPVHLLDEEAEALADGLRAVPCERLPEELEVRAEAHELLVHVPSLREIRDLARKPVLVDLHLFGELGDGDSEPIPLGDEPLRRARSDLVEKRRHGVQPLDEVLLEAH